VAADLIDRRVPGSVQQLLFGNYYSGIFHRGHRRLRFRTEAQIRTHRGSLWTDRSVRAFDSSVGGKGPQIDVFEEWCDITRAAQEERAELAFQRRNASGEVRQ
jgi:hypothetical protein